MARRAPVRLTPLRRHLAAVVTIALSCAFVAVMVLAGNLMTSALRSDITQRFEGADVVITRPLDEGDRASQQPLPAPRVEGAEHVWPLVDTMLNLRSEHEPRGTFVTVGMLPPAGTGGPSLLEGSPAEGPHEVVVDQAAADALGVGAGDELTVPAEYAPTLAETVVTVTGVAAGAESAAFGAPPRILLSPRSAGTLLGPTAGTVTEILLASVTPDVEPARVATGATEGGITVTTAEDMVQEMTTERLRGFGALALVFGVFVVIALFTGVVVIANSFAVTLAQRTRSLALLRTLGATRRQVGAVVLRESLIVGALGALIGVLAGHLVVQGALAGAVGLGWLKALLPVPVSVLSVGLPVLAGVIVTLAAGLGPARASTRVAPLQALRPAAAAPGRGLGRRGAAGLVTAVAGVAALAGGTALSLQGTAGPGILLAMAGGVLSFSGVLLALVVVTRPLTDLVGSLLTRLGRLPARIARANVARNPRRSAATIAALLIGTTLMTMMAVGARTAEATLTSELDSRRPIDLVITAQEMPTDAADRIAAVPGVDAVHAAHRGDIEVGATDAMTLYGATPDAVREVSHRPGLAEDLVDGVVLLGLERAAKFGVEDGQVLEVEGPAGTLHELRVQVDANLQMSLVTPATLQSLVGGSATPVLLADMSDPGSAARDGADVFTVVAAVQEEMSGGGFVEPAVEAGGAERETYGRILGILLGITVALLAVAVLVALVGVANTLSLGVIERTGENALLRALGTSRRQMRAMLGWEGVLLSLVGAVLGILIGSVYGVLGITAVLGSAYPVSITIPWGQVGAVLLLAVLAGALASVLPGRTAARTAPAGALARAE